MIHYLCYHKRFIDIRSYNNISREKAERFTTRFHINVNTSAWNNQEQFYRNIVNIFLLFLGQRRDKFTASGTFFNKKI